MKFKLLMWKVSCLDSILKIIMKRCKCQMISFTGASQVCVVIISL
jgi:hypothetical protein